MKRVTSILDMLNEYFENGSATKKDATHLSRFIVHAIKEMPQVVRDTLIEMIVAHTHVSETLSSLRSIECTEQVASELKVCDRNTSKLWRTIEKIILEHRFKQTTSRIHARILLRAIAQAILTQQLPLSEWTRATLALNQDVIRAMRNIRRKGKTQQGAKGTRGIFDKYELRRFPSGQLQVEAWKVSLHTKSLKCIINSLDEQQRQAFIGSYPNVYGATRQPHPSDTFIRMLLVVIGRLIQSVEKQLLPRGASELPQRERVLVDRLYDDRFLIIELLASTTEKQ